MLQWFDSRPLEITSQWHQRWMDFRANISARIEQLQLPTSLKHDIRDVVMCLTLNVWHSLNPKILNPAMKMRFTVRGDVHVSRMFEVFMESTLSVPDLPQEKMYDLLKDACYLYQDESVHLILCELLASERRGRSGNTREVLVTTLSNATRTIEIQQDIPYLRWGISFQLTNVSKDRSWSGFVTKLNSKHLKDIWFSFGQNVLNVSTKFQGIHDITFLWPKLTTTERFRYAEDCFNAALIKSEAHLLIRVMHFLGPTERMQLVKENLVAIVMCFLKHPHDRYFLPDFQFVEENLPQKGGPEFIVLYWHFLELFLEGKFCNNHRTVLVRLWQYLWSKNKLLADRVLREIRMHLDDFEGAAWFRRQPRSDATEAVSELRQILPL